MFKKLSEAIKKMSREIPAFDATKFNDPLANRIEWKPLKRGGANFKTYQLVQVDYHRIEFKASMMAKIFYFIFLGVGLGIMTIYGGIILAEGLNLFSAETIFPMIFGLGFAVIGLFLFYFGTTPIVFDKTTGFFWKGRKDPSRIYDPGQLKIQTLLQDIHALQIIRERVSSSKSSYYSYELNLVLKDGRRLNIIDHGNIKQIRSDAKTLAQFLGCPVWDALL